MVRIIQYFKDVKGELKHINWPTRRQAVLFTVVVIVISVLTAYFLGFFDFIFTTLMERFVL